MTSEAQPILSKDSARREKSKCKAARIYTYDFRGAAYLI